MLSAVSVTMLMKVIHNKWNYSPGKADRPESILLCDSCDAGWHLTCLRPALMVIPEGDWFCPACNHKKLLTSLTEKLTELDGLLKKTEAERRRKERLAFIQKGLSKTLPSAQKQKEASKKEPEYTSDESSSDTDSEDEVLLPRRCRTKNPIKYNTEEYDSMMNKALQGDIKYQVKDAPPPAISDESEEESEEDESEKASPGKPRAGQGKGKSIDNCSDESEEESDESAKKKPKPIKMSINKMKGGKKKKKRLTTLDGSDESGDGDSGSDFKLSDELSEEDDFINDLDGSDSDDYRGKKRKGGRGGRGEPSRRSTRARRNRLDDDFVNDGSDSEDYAPKKKKSKWASETSESERYVVM